MIDQESARSYLPSATTSNCRTTSFVEVVDLIGCNVDNMAGPAGFAPFLQPELALKSRQLKSSRTPVVDASVHWVHWKMLLVQHVSTIPKLFAERCLCSRWKEKMHS